MLIRLTPFIPYNITNFMMGATSVTLSDFLVGNIGEIPEVLLLLYIGTALR